MITLHIQGTIEQAKQAAEKHQITLENLIYLRNRNITVAQVKHFHIRKKLSAWFSEFPECPSEGFPPGTLLMHD